MRSTLYVSFGPRNSSIGRCENLSRILDLRLTVDAGLSGVISYRKTFFSFPNRPANVIFYLANSLLLPNIIHSLENYKT